MDALKVVGVIALLFPVVALFLYFVELMESLLVKLRLFSRSQSSVRQLHFLALLGFAFGCWLSWEDVPFQTAGLGFFVTPAIITGCVYLAPIAAAIFIDPTVVIHLFGKFWSFIKRRIGK